MEKLDTREWLLTNGLGSFASGTVGDAHTRTYHGWLIAALEPPNQRRLLLSYIDASIEVDGYHYDLGTNYWKSGEVGPEGYRWLQSFDPPPVPTWTWAKESWRFSRRILLPHWTCTLGLDTQTTPAGLNFTDHSTQANEITNYNPSAAQLYGCHRVLIHYQYEGRCPAVLTLRPLIGDRFFHYQQRASEQLHFSQVIAQQHLLLQAICTQWSGTPWCLRWTNGTYCPDGLWYWDYCYPEETRRGLSDVEDLYSPGYLTVILHPGESVTLEARVGETFIASALTPTTFEEAISLERQRFQQQVIDPAQGYLSSQLYASRQQTSVALFDGVSLNPDGDQDATGLTAPDNLDLLWTRLLYAGDQCLAYRQSGTTPTVIAGYPWFEDWFRQMLIALPGLTLTTRRFAVARQLLQSAAQYCERGLIPSTLPEDNAQMLHPSLDVSLWWIETLGLYLEATQDWDFLVEQYPTVQAIYKALITGTSHNIGADAVDGLITWNSPTVALTWMDTVIDGAPVTPRTGKVIEINALWYSGLCWARQWVDQLKEMAVKAEDTKRVQSLTRQAQRYDQQIDLVRTSLKAFWNPQQGYFYDRICPDDAPDSSVRPNGILALSLAHCGFSQTQGQQALEVAIAHLLTPYGLRSLAPSDPNYQSHYAGNMNCRDRAYHQGTVWSWLLGPFIRAWQRFYGDTPDGGALHHRPLPFDTHLILNHITQQVCLGSVSEIFDGDDPHIPQGAISQAWSVAEIIRHWDMFID
ncbi:MAG: amylo-alpha-1,6-glucosidase [Cyanothece sp. SIO2G6]|nr:amylo-alpha-1,6-glucosidase [Cyanothece sp. SIO2G6]